MEGVISWDSFMTRSLAKSGLRGALTVHRFAFDFLHVACRIGIGAGDSTFDIESAAAKLDDEFLIRAKVCFCDFFLLFSLSRM